MTEVILWAALWAATGYGCTFLASRAVAWALGGEPDYTQTAGEATIATLFGPVMMVVVAALLGMGVLDRAFDRGMRKQDRMRKDAATRTRERRRTALGVFAVFAAIVAVVAWTRAHDDTAASAAREQARAASEQARYDAACAPLGAAWRGHRQADGSWVCIVTMVTGVPAGGAAR